MMFYRLLLQDIVEALLKIHSNFIGWKKWLNIQRSLSWLKKSSRRWDVLQTRQKQGLWHWYQQTFAE
jgi:hypothetical protein